MATNPIKVGIIGLSRPGGWATVAHLPYLKQTTKYKIVAVANSSVESSQKAINTYGLSKETKAYGNTEDLAKDPNVELVVNTTRVDNHLSTSIPILKAGKSMYVEWPLGRNLSEAEQLLSLSKDKNVKIAQVGLQGRQAPVSTTLKQLVESERVGKILSSTLVAAVGDQGHTQNEQYKYLGRREVGGNLMSIHLGHIIDSVQFVLGYGFDPAPKSLVRITRETMKLTNAAGEVTDPAYKRDAPDFIAINGNLSSGVALSFTIRGGKPFKGTPPLQWQLYGEKGEIRVTSSSAFLNFTVPNLKIEIHDFERDEVEVVEIKGREIEGMELGMPADNVARAYEAIAEGVDNCTFEDAVERHRFLNSLWKENGFDEL